jgi:tetratricopeptide (TPR) repeat protein
MRRQTADVVKTTLNYLHTRPVTTTVERVAVRAPAANNKKKDAPVAHTTREHERRFLVVADLLAAPGAINFRVIGDDYYAVVPPDTDLSASEVRRAYLQYVVDPMVIRFSRDIALKRADIQSILDARAKLTPGAATPTVFPTVARSLVIAADARINAQARLADLSSRATLRLQTAKDSERAALTKEVQDERAAIEDETTAQLADAYERGAVLDFYFAEQLRDQESAGFDFSDAIPDVIARVDPNREMRRPEEYAAARARVVVAREKAAKEAASVAPADAQDAGRRLALFKNLDEVSRMLQAKNYAEAEARLRSLLEEYRGEPRVFFALGQTWSAGAADAANEETRDLRLNNALLNYGNAIQSADRSNDLALISRAHVARGRILAFLERKDEAIKEFDAAIEIGKAGGSAYDDAVAAKKKLQP